MRLLYIFGSIVVIFSLHLKVCLSVQVYNNDKVFKRAKLLKVCVCGACVICFLLGWGLSLFRELDGH